MVCSQKAPFLYFNCLLWNDFLYIIPCSKWSWALFHSPLCLLQKETTFMLCNASLYNIAPEWPPLQCDLFSDSTFSIHGIPSWVYQGFPSKNQNTHNHSKVTVHTSPNLFGHINEQKTYYIHFITRWQFESNECSFNLGRHPYIESLDFISFKHIFYNIISFLSSIL